jgi:hypothetical protein
VDDAKTRVRETNVDVVKSIMDRGDKFTGTEDNSEAKPLAQSRGTLTVKWADLETKSSRSPVEGELFS